MRHDLRELRARIGEDALAVFGRELVFEVHDEKDLLDVIREDAALQEIELRAREDLFRGQEEDRRVRLGQKTECGLFAHLVEVVRAWRVDELDAALEYGERRVELGVRDACELLRLPAVGRQVFRVVRERLFDGGDAAEFLLREGAGLVAVAVMQQESGIAVRDAVDHRRRRIRLRRQDARAEHRVDERRLATREFSDDDDLERLLHQARSPPRDAPASVLVRVLRRRRRWRRKPPRASPVS